VPKSAKAEFQFMSYVSKGVKKMKEDLSTNESSDSIVESSSHPRRLLIPKQQRLLSERSHHKLTSHISEGQMPLPSVPPSPASPVRGDMSLFFFFHIH